MPRLAVLAARALLLPTALARAPELRVSDRDGQPVAAAPAVLM
jgi:hypothetical protein